MKDEMFNELIGSVREGAAILRGDAPPARSFTADASSIRALRERHKLSQSGFAKFLRISVDTLKNWEQGRRKPAGPAERLLQIVAEHPEVVGK